MFISVEEYHDGMFCEGHIVNIDLFLRNSLEDVYPKVSVVLFRRCHLLGPVFEALLE